MAFSLTKCASRTAVRSTTSSRKVPNVQCQAMPDFKAPVRNALISAATVAAALSMTMGAVASEDLNAAAQRTASQLGSVVSSSNPLGALKNKIGNPLSGAEAQVKQVTGKLENPIKAGSDAIQSTADNIVKDTPFAGTKVSKAVPIQDSANGPDPTGRIKYN